MFELSPLSANKSASSGGFQGTLILAVWIGGDWIWI